ncbi:MAG: 3-phosphoshikimate 1-carboxyvinyltransferase [Holdemanella sp.]|nr:3-phosphoshikimate 1-carboxyvinyltransferase [Holdemanella sp.]
MKVKIIPSTVEGSIEIPASKSMAHRAIICASLSKGTSVISNITYSKDIDATIQCMEALGAAIQKNKSSCTITGCDLQNVKDSIVCDCFESGSTLRFLIPIASLTGKEIIFKGQGRLLARPMEIYQELFDHQSLSFIQSDDSIKIKGSLKPGAYVLKGDVSSQFISGLLFALPLMDADSTIEILPPYESKSYVNLTISMLKQFGIQIEETSEYAYSIKGNQQYISKDISVEGDYSQMAFFAVLGALNHTISCHNMNPDSAQGDKIILDFVKKAGALLDVKDSTITISPDSRHGQIIDLSNCPDLGPVLCVLASYIPSKTIITHAKRLRMKESDRIEAMECELRKWGVDIASTEDEIIIYGKDGYENAQEILIQGHNDHRIVMAMTIFALCAKSPSFIEGAQAIEKSYPDFFKDISIIQGKVEIL